MLVMKITTDSTDVDQVRQDAHHGRTNHQTLLSQAHHAGQHCTDSKHSKTFVGCVGQAQRTCPQVSMGTLVNPAPVAAQITVYFNQSSGILSMSLRFHASQNQLQTLA